MSHTKFVALFLLLASGVVQANQCSRDGGCPSDGESQNVASLLQTKLQMDVVKDSVDSTYFPGHLVLESALALGIE